MQIALIRDSSRQSACTSNIFDLYSLCAAVDTAELNG